MAQKQLPILNRTGIFQRWSGLWDSPVNYKYYHRYNLFFTEMLQEFIEHRNTIKAHIRDRKYCEQNIIYVKKVPATANFEQKLELIQAHKKKRQPYIYLGQIHMLKLQKWLMFIIFTYKPAFKKTRLTRRKPKRRFFILRHFSRSNVYPTFDADYSNIF